MITYKQAKKLYNEYKQAHEYSFEERLGAHVGNLYILKCKNRFLITKNNIEIYINNKDHYTLTNIKPTKADIKFVNEMTPCKAKLFKGKIKFDNMPYYNGITLNKQSDIVIPRAVEFIKRYLECQECGNDYTQTHCHNCY